MLSPSEKSKQSTWLACLINLSLQRHTNKRVTTTWYLKSCQLEFPDWWMLHRALTSRLRLPNEIVCPTDVPDSFCNWNWIPAEISYARKISINSVNFSAERIYGQLVHCTTRGETSELLGDTLPLRHPHATTPTASCRGSFTPESSSNRKNKGIDWTMEKMLQILFRSCAIVPFMCWCFGL